MGFFIESGIPLNFSFFFPLFFFSITYCLCLPYTTLFPYTYTYNYEILYDRYSMGHTDPNSRSEMEKRTGAKWKRSNIPTNLLKRGVAWSFILLV